MLPETSNLAQATLVMGTAQLGMTYGIANTTTLAESAKLDLLAQAVQLGIRTFDTARAYGTSEAVIGRFISERPDLAASVEIVTKLDPLARLPEDAAPEVAAAAVYQSVQDSCTALRLHRLPTLLLHRAQHLLAWDGAGWRALEQMRNEGMVGRIGVSVQSPEELAVAIAQPAIEQVQLPFNLLDWRWDSVLPALLERRAAGRFIVHVRSIYLQGLLLTDNPAAWRRAHVDDRDKVLGWLNQSSALCLNGSVAGLCLAFARAQPWIDGLVVGMDNTNQLAANVALARSEPLSQAMVTTLRASRPRLAAESLDPACWKGPQG